MRHGWIPLVVIGCSHPAPAPAPAPEEHHHHHGHRFDHADDWAKVFDDPARDAWQHPDDVIGALELAPAMTVADVGAGTGYFTTKIAKLVTAGHVIGTDIEPDMVRYLTERAARDKLPNVTAVLATGNDPKLDAASVDRILVVDVWHHVEDRAAYAKGLAAALRPGGFVAIVDFTMEANHGPPAAMRLAPATIVADLASAGLAASVSPVKLPDQFIVIGKRP